MSSQPQDSDRSSAPRRPGQESLRSEVIGVVADLIELLQLQLRLTWLDAQAAQERAAPALARAAVGLAIAIGAIPIALLALADGLTLAFHLSPLAARGAVSGVAIVVGVLLVNRSLRVLATVGDDFHRSATELQQNVRWLSHLLDRHREE
ncbi:MAG: phage holin family protein [Pirellulales bacterium]